MRQQLQRYPYFIATLVMILFGSLDMVRGVAAPMMQQDWHLSYFELSNIFVSNSIGYLMGSFSSGFVVVRIGTRRTIVTGGVGLAVALVLTIQLQSYIGLIVAFFTAGLATGWQEIGVNHVVPEMTTDGPLQSKLFNWLHGLYGVGAFVFPSIAGMLIHVTHRWRFPYIILLLFLVGVLTLALLHWTAKQATPASASEPTSSKAELALVPTWEQTSLATVDSAEEMNGGSTPASLTTSILHTPLMYALVLSISLYVMAEIGVGSWLTTYLVHGQGLLINVGSYVLSAFYFTFTVGRLTAHLWVPKVGNERSVVVSAMVGIGLFSLALVTSYGGSYFKDISLAAFALSGFGFAVIFPTITSIASYEFASHSGKILGFLFTASGVGSLLVNWLIGVISTACGIRTGIWMVVVFLVGTLMATAWVWVLTNSSTRSGMIAARH